MAPQFYGLGADRSSWFSTSYTDFIDWKTFIYEKLVEDMAARYNAIRKVDATHLITAHAVGVFFNHPTWVQAPQMTS